MLLAIYLKYLKNCWRYKVDSLHVGTYLSTLQIDDVILDGRGQQCPKRLLKI